MRPKHLRILILSLPLAIGLVGCGTVDLIGHARIHNDLLYSPGPKNPIENQKSAVVVEVDGQPAQAAPLPSLADDGPHPAAWVSAGRHLFKIGVTPSAHPMGMPDSIEYVTFSATVRSGTDYLLLIVNDNPMLYEHREGPGMNSLPPLNQPIPITVVAESR
jgi:hypothetical protein